MIKRSWWLSLREIKPLQLYESCRSTDTLLMVRILPTTSSPPKRIWRTCLQTNQSRLWASTGKSAIKSLAWLVGSKCFTQTGRRVHSSWQRNKRTKTWLIFKWTSHKSRSSEEPAIRFGCLSCTSKTRMAKSSLSWHLTSKHLPRTKLSKTMRK